jgi:hypothetical protein
VPGDPEREPAAVVVVDLAFATVFAAVTFAARAPPVAAYKLRPSSLD